MVVLRLRKRAHTVYEAERLDEARELERPLECSVDLCPTVGGHGASIYDRRPMTASTEDVPGNAPQDAQPRRAGRELLLDAVFRPLSNLLVPGLARLGVAPAVVVVANAVTGLLAALALASGHLLAAAVLLQVKSLLDNADGQLARATGRVTLAGRYLDTEADLVVNAALFVALAHVIGQPLFAGLAFVALTLVLAADFNVTELYREAYNIAGPEPLPSGSRAERTLARIYAVVLAPLDRFVRGLSERRFERLVPAETSPEHVRDARRSYFDRFTVTVLANLGLTTQLVVLGVWLALGAPQAYLWFALACVLSLLPLQARAEARARATLRPRRGV